MSMSYKYWRKILARIKLRLFAYIIVVYLTIIKLFKLIIRKKPISNTIIVLVPNKFKIGELNASGSNKDIESMFEDLHKYRVEFIPLLISKNPFFAVYEIIFKYKKLSHLLSARQILISMPGSILSLLLILRLICSAKIVVRVHNAELFHRMDYAKLTKSFWLRFVFIKKSIQGALSDISITIFANRILQINDYEMNVYWIRLNPFVKNKYIFFPYKPPLWIHREIMEKKFALILGSFDKNTLTAAPGISFLNAGESVNRFVKSNKLDLLSVGNTLDISFNYKHFHFVESLLDVLNSTKVLLVPSGFGWGFKTKIGDALFFNQAVIVPRDLYNKSGIWKDRLIPIDDWSKIDSLEISDQIDNGALIQSINDIRSNCIKSVFFQNS